jgi:hypothetical protein
MTLGVLGAGFGRTGTLSLKTALEQLGIGRCYHMLEVANRSEHTDRWLAAARGEPVSWREIFSEYSAAVDWPAATFWREILAAAPHARVILTIRDSSEWFASFRETILAKMRGPPPPRSMPIRPVYELTKAVILERTFNGRADDEQHATRVYESHNRSVIAAVEPQRLLVYDVSAGWEPLCRFLEQPVPSGPFPHLNRRMSFERNLPSAPRDGAVAAAPSKR